MEYRHRDLAAPHNPGTMRWIAGIVLPISVLVLTYALWRFDPMDYNDGLFFLFCPFHKLTGLYCPGCGATRAAHALLHLDVGIAIRDNALMVLFFGPAAFYWCVREYLRLVMRRSLLPSLRFGRRTLYLLLAAVVLFTVLRNIPALPFSLLAPVT